jgi:tetratricopeptide (TPR) repeat protein
MNRLPLLLSLLLLPLLLLRPASAAEPTGPGAASWREARALLAAGEPAAALEKLRVAVEQDGDVQIHRDYQDLMRAQGYGAQARTEYRARRDAAPKNADLRFLYGRSTGDPAAARAEYDEGLKIDPSNAWCRQGLGGVSAAENKLDEALRHYEQALKLRPDWAEVHNKMANVRMAQGDRPAAQQAWRAAIAADPADHHAYMNLGAMLSMEGRLDEAAAIMAQGITRSPDNPLAHTNLGYVLLKLRRLDDSVASFERALAINPRDREVQGALNLARDIRSGAIPFEAFAPFEEALAASSADPQRAMQKYREVILLAPGFAFAHMNLGLVQMALGDPQALVPLRKAAELAPGDVAARFNYGFALMGAGRLDEAAGHLKTAVNLDPEDVDSISTLALCELGLGRHDAAIAGYDRALNLSPRNPLLLIQLGAAYAEAGQVAQAEQAMRQALEAAPGFLQGRIQLVALLAQAGRHEDALVELAPLEQAVPGDPQLASLKAQIIGARDARTAAKAQGKIRLQRILVASEADARDIAARARSGAAFEELAVRGTGPEKAAGGDIGWVSTSDLRGEVQRAVDTLQVGGVSEPVQLGSTWAVFRRAD